MNLVAGDTYGELCGVNQDSFGEIPECAPVDSASIAAPSNGKLGTMIGDTDPYWDICSVGSDGNSQTAAYTGRNVGDLLNDAKVTWGCFQGGFKLTPDGGCNSSHVREA